MENLYKTKLIKIGSSHGIIIPIRILQGTGIKRGDTLTFGGFAPLQFFVRALTDLEIKTLRESKPII